jgi:hypothetical protein
MRPTVWSRRGAVAPGRRAFTAPALAPAVALAGAIAALVPAPARAQDGAGTTGAGVLQLPAGSRAPGLSGAYTALADADALFYNPSGIARLDAAVSLSWQRYVESIGLYSGAAALRAGPVTLGAAVQYLDYGSIDEIVPDPDHGGQTGRPTGARVGASEVAARLAAGLPLLDGRLAIGLAAGLVSTELAGAARAAPFLDAGAQYRALRGLTLGAALRGLGGAQSGGGLADAPLPTEVRAGGALDLAGGAGLGAILAAEVVSRVRERSTGAALGLEAGLRPADPSGIGAVARIGYDSEAADGLGGLRVGGGLDYAGIGLDYTYERYDFFGAVHRIGVRWRR